MGLAAARPQPATQGSTQRPPRGCRVRHRTPLGAAGSSLGFGQGVITPLRGYLLLAACGGVAVYNATGAAQRHGPREVVAARLADLAAEIVQAKPSQTAGARTRSIYLIQHTSDGTGAASVMTIVFGNRVEKTSERRIVMPLQAPHDSAGAPVLAAGRRRLVVLGLGGRFVAIFEARLPSAAVAAAPGEAWFRPALALAALAVGYYQFMRMRCVPWPRYVCMCAKENMLIRHCAQHCCSCLTRTYIA